jgi:hypothetical protein
MRLLGIPNRLLGISTRLLGIRNRLLGIENERLAIPTRVLDIKNSSFKEYRRVDVEALVLNVEVKNFNFEMSF